MADTRFQNTLLRAILCLKNRFQTKKFSPINTIKHADNPLAPDRVKCHCRYSAARGIRHDQKTTDRFARLFCARDKCQRAEINQKAMRCAGPENDKNPVTLTPGLLRTTRPKVQGPDAGTTATEVPPLSLDPGKSKVRHPETIKP